MKTVREHSFWRHVIASVTLLAYALSYSPRTAYAQPDTTTSEPFALSAREKELQRKEEELLRVMQGVGVQQTLENSETTTLEPKRNTMPVLTVDSPSESSDNNTTGSERPNQLRALESHPALDDRPVRAPNRTAPNASSSIRTYVPDNHPDGTTAKRLGTYTRVIPGYGQSGSEHRETARTHTVSLNDIQEEASIRPASLSYEEIATVRGGSSHLRTGPSRLDTNLMPLPQYSEVVIDYRSGNWYRVRTRAGVRGWISGTALLFDAGISPRSAVRVSAVKGSPR